MSETAPSDPATPGAVLFDVDGTLVDSVYQHVQAWWEAFRAAGHSVPCAAIHRTVGRGSADLVETLLGRPDEAVVAGHAERWGRVRERTAAFPRVPELLAACAGRGLAVVLCTSGEEADVEFFVRAIGGDGPLRAVVSAADVDRSKPDPQIVQRAVEAAGAPPQRCVLVGDTVYDVQAALAAGVRPVAVQCGGIGTDELRAAGATAVLGDPAELLDALPQWAPG